MAGPQQKQEARSTQNTAGTSAHGFALDRRAKYLGQGPSADGKVQGLRAFAFDAERSRTTLGGPQSGKSQNPAARGAQRQHIPSLGLRTPDLRTMPSAQLHSLRQQVRERKAALLESFSKSLDSQEAALVEKLDTGKDLRNGARTNYQNDKKALSEARSGVVYRFVNWSSGLTETYEKQVETSHRMWQDHEKRVTKIEETMQDARKQKEKALEAMQKFFSQEEKKLELLEQINGASGEKKKELEAALNALLSDRNAQSLEREAEQALATAFNSLTDAAKPVDFAKHRAMLRGMNEEFSQGIANLDTTENVLRIGSKIVVVTAAGAFALSTAGAGTPVLLAALYAGGAGMAGKALINAGEIAGHAGYGNIRDSQHFQEMVSKGAEDAAWTGVESAVAGLGMGWAGHSMRFNSVAVKLASRGRLGLGSRALQQAAARNSNFLYRNSQAVRNAWRMATPNTFFHTGMQLNSGDLKWEFDQVLTSILGNYAIATVCAGNSQAGAAYRSSLQHTATRQVLSREFGKNLFVPNSTARSELVKYAGGQFWRTASFSAEKYLDYKAADWGSMVMARRLGVDVDSEAYQQQRYLNLLTGALSDVTGMASHRMGMRNAATQQQRADTVAQGASTRARNQQQNTLLQGAAPEVAVVASKNPGVAQQRQTSRNGQAVVETSLDPHLANADAATMNGVVDRMILRNADVDGTVEQSLSRSLDRANYATNSSAVAKLSQGRVAEVITGTRQSAEQTQQTLTRSLGRAVDEPTRQRITDTLTTGPRRSIDDKIDVVETTLGRELSVRERNSLSKGLRADTDGELHDAFLRNAGVEIDPRNPQRTRQTLQENSDQLIAESLAVSRRSVQGQGLDPLRIVPQRIQNGWQNIKQRWNAAKEVGWGVGSTLTLAEQGIGFLGVTAGQFAHSTLGGVSTGPLLVTRSLIEVPVALFQTGLDHSRPFRSALGFTPAKPRDAARTFALREQVRHRVELIESMQRRGDLADLDPNVLTGLRQAEKDLTTAFNRANNGSGMLRRVYRVVGKPVIKENSPSAQALRSSIHDAAARGLDYSPQVQVNAVREQGLTLIRTRANAAEFESLVALGRDRLQPQVMREITAQWQREINSRPRAADAGDAAGAGTTANRAEGGQGQNSAARRHNERVSRNNERGGRNEALSGVLRRYRDPAQRQTLVRNDNVTVDSVYRQVQFEQSRARIETWIDNAADVNVNTAQRELAMLLEIPPGNRQDIRTQQLDTLQRRLTDSLATTPPGDKRNALQALNQAVGARRALQDDATAVLAASTDQDGLTASIQELFQNTRTAMGGRRNFGATEEVEVLLRLREAAQEQGEAATARGADARVWTEREKWLRKLITTSFAQQPIHNRARLPRINSFQMRNQRPRAVQDIRDTNVMTVEHNPIGRQDRHTAESFTLREMQNRGAATLANESSIFGFRRQPLANSSWLREGVAPAQTLRPHHWFAARRSRTEAQMRVDGDG